MLPCAAGHFFVSPLARCLLLRDRTWSDRLSYVAAARRIGSRLSGDQGLVRVASAAQGGSRAHGPQAVQNVMAIDFDSEFIEDAHAVAGEHDIPLFTGKARLTSFPRFPQHSTSPEDYFR